MIYRQLGKQRNEVSILGFGCMRFPVDSDQLIKKEESEKMLLEAINNGVNYLDTAYPYHNGESELFVGEFLKKHNLRDKIYLATKLPSWLINTKADMEKYITEQLDKLQVDYIDYFLFHTLNKEWWETYKDNGVFEFIDDIIWKKPESSCINRQANFFQTRKPLSYRPNQVTEYILVYRKNDDKKRTGDFFKGIDEEVIESSKVLDGYETSNVWEIAPQTNSKHPAPYPYLLPKNVIEYYSFKGDIVLDPFLGSGTSCYAASDLKREYIAYEISKKYINMSQDRLTNMFAGI
jgi:hypothetical protein